MRDDIVRRMELMDVPPGSYDEETLYDAIDEIKRLRIENRAVKDAYEHLAEISKSQRETMTKYLFPQEEQQ